MNDDLLINYSISQLALVISLSLQSRSFIWGMLQSEIMTQVLQRKHKKTAPKWHHGVNPVILS